MRISKNKPSLEFHFLFPLHTLTTARMDIWIPIEPSLSLILRLCQSISKISFLTSIFEDENTFFFYFSCNAGCHAAIFSHNLQDKNYLRCLEITCRCHFECCFEHEMRDTTGLEMYRKSSPIHGIWIGWMFGSIVTTTVLVQIIVQIDENSKISNKFSMEIGATCILKT